MIDTGDPQREQRLKRRMPNFFHELPEAKDLIETVANDMHLNPFLVEKDYWVMHCLWGLQQHQQFQFEMKGGTALSKGWCGHKYVYVR